MGGTAEMAEEQKGVGEHCAAYSKFITIMNKICVGGIGLLIKNQVHYLSMNFIVYGRTPRKNENCGC